MRSAARFEVALLAIALGLFAALCLLSMRAKSPTFDEVAYLPAGYMHLTRGDFRLMSEHPPLLKCLAALPLLAMDVHVDTTDHAWARRRYFEFGRRFLFLWNDADRLVLAGRLTVVALGAALVLAVFAWARLRFGGAVALVAAFLCALSPDVLAHGQLVTTDVPITLLILLSVAGFDRLLQEVTWRRLVLGGLVLGAALATKFSALILLPMLGAVGIAVALSSRPMVLALGGRPLRPVTGTAGRLAIPAISLAAMGLIAPFVIWAAYGLHARVTPDPAVNEAFTLDHERPTSQLIWSSARAAQAAHLLPDGFLYGFLRFAKHSEKRKAFLLGERSEDGWWYYFPLTLAIKTPVPLLLLVTLAAASGFMRSGRSVEQALLWLPVVVYLGVAMARSLNIGHRHLLPIYPFLFILAGRALAWLWHAPGRARAVARAIAVILPAWYAASVLHVHPHYLAYFNELVGGPAQGYRYLVDSNLDWGQDLPGLKVYLDANHIETVKLSYFGTAEPAYYGILAERLPGHPPPETTAAVRPGDVVAVSATNLQAVYFEGDADAERLMRRLRRLDPMAAIGHSIFVYRADFNWSRR